MAHGTHLMQKKQSGDSLTCYRVEKNRFPKEDQGLIQYSFKMGGRDRKERKIPIIAFCMGQGQNALS